MSNLANSYKLYTLSTGDYGCLVICLSYDSIFSYIQNLQDELRDKGIDNADILIDQLLISGNGKNRFLSIPIENGEFVFTSAKNVEADPYYHQLTSSELERNQRYLKNSILTTKQQSLILRGCVV